MNEAHFHLVVNHLPIIFPLVGLIVLGVGFFSKVEAVTRTAYLIFILGSIATILAMTSGEGAEEVVEKISGINESYINTHEEAAETFAIVSYVLGVVSLIGLWASFTRKSFASLMAIVTLVVAVATLFLAKQTGTTGGEIRHTEIRGDAGQSLPANAESEKEDD